MSNIHTTIAQKIMLLLAAGIASAAFSADANATGLVRTPESYGAAAPARATAKTITITPETKWVNVNDGDTVTFVKNDKAFTWHFATLRRAEDLQLSKIAPADFMLGNVVVYVDTNPLYRG